MPGEITLHDATTGHHVARIASVPRETYTSLAYHPTGTRLASGALGLTGAVTLWDLADPSASVRLIGRGLAVLCVCFSPDGALVAAGAVDGLVRVWDSASGALVSTLDAGSRVHGVAFSADGTSLIAGGDSQPCTVWSMPGGHALGVIPTGIGHTVYALACSPDGQSLLVGSGDDYECVGTATLWDLATGTRSPVVFDLLGEDGDTDGIAYAVAISADGRSMAAGTSTCVYSWRRHE